ncbi:hypothetical protein BESB_024160 [Besnoitia besnoiti]|uniref:Protein kinase domain-containing protein n=1 Tax=Besnoitia besnoiti TaxID=94643 RepID=A0A2A9M3X8_BESBE|nr:hypothetical protein BESB_024160 [Besnoitia besnoiti]PFH31924.1 hypothetical protein BESB_024160 [Besnoitia besnoiti]
MERLTGGPHSAGPPRLPFSSSPSTPLSVSSFSAVHASRSLSSWRLLWRLRAICHRCSSLVVSLLFVLLLCVPELTECLGPPTLRFHRHTRAARKWKTGADGRQERGATGISSLLEQPVFRKPRRLRPSQTFFRLSPDVSLQGEASSLFAIPDRNVKHFQLSLSSLKQIARERLAETPGEIRRPVHSDLQNDGRVESVHTPPFAPSSPLVSSPSSDSVPLAPPSAFAQTQKKETASPGKTSETKNALAFLGVPAVVSERNPPVLSRTASASAPSTQEEELAKANSLPLCEIQWDILGPMLGSGSYGGVYPLLQPACPDVTKSFVGRKFAVKIFRLKRAGIMAHFDSISDGKAPQTDTETLHAIESQIRAIPASNSIYQKMVRVIDPSIDAQKTKNYAGSLTHDIVLTESNKLRAVINTHSFFSELCETGTIFQQMETFIKRNRPDVWTALEGASEEAKASKYAEIGIAENHWSLPLARVVVNDTRGIKHWGLLIELHHGDLEPKAKKRGSPADSWLPMVISSQALREIFGSRTSLLSLTSKVLKPFVKMHNLYLLGHFDIKPANILYKYLPAQNGRAAGLSIAAADFGMASRLYSPMPIRGTLSFMAPDMERVPGGLTSSPEFDVYALGLTLAWFWTSATEVNERAPWVEKCIKPALKRSADSGGSVAFTFQRFASKTGPRIYDEQTLAALDGCFALGGKIEKLYHTEMPLLARLKISQMVDLDPRARCSMRHAELTFKVLSVTDQLSRGTPGGATADADEEKLKRLQEMPLMKYLLYYLHLKPLTVARDNRTEYRLINRAMLEFAQHTPLHAAAAEEVEPLPLDFFHGEKDWAAATIDITEEEVDAVIKRARTVLASETLSAEGWTDLVDIVFGVTPEGLRTLARRAVYRRKTFVLQQEIAKAVRQFVTSLYKVDAPLQLVAEDPPPRLFEFVRAELALSPPEATKLGRRITRGALQSFSAWARIDRCLRQAFRLAVESPSNSATRDAAAALESGRVPAPEQEKALYDAIFSTFESMTAASHSGLPWGPDAVSDFGVAAEEMSRYVRSTHIALIAKMWPYSAHRQILDSSIQVAVRRLLGEQATLPDSLSAVYEMAFGALPRYAHVNMPFLVGLEREEYTRILFNYNLSKFKEAVGVAATRHELKIAVEKAVDALGADAEKSNDEELAENLMKELLPQHIRIAPPARFGWKEQANIRTSILDFVKDVRRRRSLAGPDMVQVRIRINGKSKPPRDASLVLHEIRKKLVAFKSGVSVSQFNEFFTRVLKESFNPFCRSFVAELKKRIKRSPAEYETVSGDTALVTLLGQDGSSIFKLVAVDPSVQGSASEPNNCFIWTPAFLADEKIIVIEAADA